MTMTEENTGIVGHDDDTQITWSARILCGMMVFVLYRTKKPSAATRCMCPLYDTNRQAWIELQPMSVARVGHGVVAAG